MGHSPVRRVVLFAIVAAAIATSALLADVPASQPATSAVSVQETRDAFLAIINRPRVDLAPQEMAHELNDGIAKFHFNYSSEANQRVPGILLAKQEVLKDAKRHPVVIVLHGTGGKKESVLDILTLLAAKDFIALAIDGRYHGERGTPADYNSAIAQAFEDGKSHPLYFDEVWDIMRLIDYLQSRPEVDPNRIGLMGISKGGIETWLTAAVDPRVSVAVPCISVQSFEWGLDNNAWPQRVSTFQKGFDAAAKSVGIDKPDAAFARKFYDRLLPGICTTFDGPRMLPLIAPRPLLVIAGDRDPRNPMPGLRLCETATRAAYDSAAAGEKFDVLVQPNTAHAVNQPAKAAAVAWFVKWMGGPT